MGALMRITSEAEEQRDKMKVEGEMSLFRVRRLVEFMRIVCGNEAKLLRDLGGGKYAGLSVQNDDRHHRG
jgi:hypothetical protein